MPHKIMIVWKTQFLGAGEEIHGACNTHLIERKEVNCVQSVVLVSCATHHAHIRINSKLYFV